MNRGQDGKVKVARSWTVSGACCSCPSVHPPNSGLTAVPWQGLGVGCPFLTPPGYSLPAEKLEGQPGLTQTLSILWGLGSTRHKLPLQGTPGWELLSAPASFVPWTYSLGSSLRPTGHGWYSGTPSPPVLLDHVLNLLQCSLVPWGF